VGSSKKLRIVLTFYAAVQVVQQYHKRGLIPFWPLGSIAVLLITKLLLFKNSAIMDNSD
jgi:hypothetical protein